MSLQGGNVYYIIGLDENVITDLWDDLSARGSDIIILLLIEGQKCIFNKLLKLDRL